jgi:DNA-binding transcriptional LysR family regulator
MRIDFLGLQGFLSIAEQGSFQRAAANLGLSQTALSHRLSKLEADLGISLIARTTRQVTLTQAGIVLLPKARRLIEELGASVEEVRQLGQARQERIAIACIPSVAMSYLPRLLAQFAAENPDVVVRVIDTTAREILDLVESETVEFGISVVTASRPGVEIRPLLKEPFVLACPSRHKLAGLESVAWSQLENEPLIRNSVIRDALGNRREGLRWRYEIMQVGTALSMVRPRPHHRAAPRHRGGGHLGSRGGAPAQPDDRADAGPAIAPGRASLRGRPLAVEPDRRAHAGIRRDRPGGRHAGKAGEGRAERPASEGPRYSAATFCGGLKASIARQSSPWG